MRKLATKTKSKSKSSGSFSSVSRLITSSEQTLSSQATIISDRSARSYSQRNDFDDFEDIINEENESIFINPQEEKHIQVILELARKGKINPNNAFDIPLKVIDPNATESSNMRFWKFSSELLSASMSIYDKRVENVYLKTNSMSDNLLHVVRKDKPQEGEISEEQAEGNQRNQRNELMKMSIEQVSTTNFMSRFEIDKQHCQQPERINIKNLRNQFIEDPLFAKKLKIFDSNTLKSLFLNTFQCNQQTEVSVFSTQVKRNFEERVNQEKGMLKMQLQQSQFIFKEISKIELLSKISRTNQITKDIQQLKMENFKDQIHDNKVNFIKDVARQVDLGDSAELEIDNISLYQRQTNEENSQIFQEDSQNIFLNPSQGQEIEVHSLSSHIPASQPQVYDNFFSIETADQQPHSMLTPWELEFKNLKLQKRTLSKRSQRQKRTRTKKLEFQIDFEIDFLPLNREKIIKSKQDKDKDPDSSPYDEKNQVGFNLDPYRKIHNWNRIMRAKQVTLTSKEQHKPYEDNHSDIKLQIEENEGFYDSMNEKETNIADLQEGPLVMQPISSQGVVNLKTYGIRNIREVKEQIMSELEQQGSIAISNTFYGISPQSMLVVFLHLANERDIIIESIENSSDVLLKMPNFQ